LSFVVNKMRSKKYYTILSETVPNSNKKIVERGNMFIIIFYRKLYFKGNVYVIPGQKKKDKWTNNDLQNITHKTKDPATRTPLKTGGEPRCSGKVSSSCSTSDTRCVNLVTNSMINHECGVYISQLIRYSRTCGSYQDFLYRGWLLTRKLRTEPRIPIG
jgi:hypothetical protein